jgi:hypothetical protein
MKSKNHQVQTMKNILIIFFFIPVFFLGCDTTSDLSVDPADINSITQTTDSMDYELISLPRKSALWMDSVFTFSQLIDGSIGGRMIFEDYYISEEGDTVAFKIDLKIPAGAFQGSETITITVDSDSAIVHFYPEMVFAETLQLFQSFEGLHLENLQTGTIDFVFIRDDGSIELIKKNGTQVVIPQGIVRVQNAKLVHFSRYGWIRKSEKTS